MKSINHLNSKLYKTARVPVNLFIRIGKELGISASDIFKGMNPTLIAKEANRRSQIVKNKLKSIKDIPNKVIKDIPNKSIKQIIEETPKDNLNSKVPEQLDFFNILNKKSSVNITTDKQVKTIKDKCSLKDLINTILSNSKNYNLNKFSSSDKDIFS